MHAILLSGGIYHDFDRMAAATAGILSSAGLRVEVVGSPAELVTSLQEGPADLVVVQALRFRMLGNEKYAPFRAEWAYETGADLRDALTGHAARGGGILALHTGCICFDDWPGWHDLLGGGWVWGQSFHAPGLEDVRVTTVEDHPATDGVTSFNVRDEHYRDLARHSGARVLAEGITSTGIAHPVAWVRDEEGFPGRALTLTTGHDLASLTEPGQARLIRQGALWAANTNERTAA